MSGADPLRLPICAVLVCSESLRLIRSDQTRPLAERDGRWAPPFDAIARCRAISGHQTSRVQTDLFARRRTRLAPM